MFEIGNKIILKEEYKNTTLSERNYIPQSVVDKIADEIHTVTNVDIDSCGYSVEIDDMGYMWNPDMFELANNIKPIQATPELSGEDAENLLKQIKFNLPKDQKEINRIVDVLNNIRN